MSNPLLETHELPPFSKIKAEHVEPAIDTLIEQNKQAIETLLDSLDQPTWDTLVRPLEVLDDKLSQAWSPVSHMNAVVNGPELREAYNNCLPKLSEYSTALGQNERLYQAYQAIADSDAFAALDFAQKKVINNALRDFKLSGISLAEDKRKEFADLKKALSELTSQYSDNVLDATQAWNKLITDDADLKGVPENALALAKQAAEEKELEGFVITLDFPSYFPVMTYCENRELRKEVYEAFVTRASDQGPFAGKFDNSEKMNEIIKLRHQLANLLDFDNYGERSLVTKMAETPEQVIGFLDELAEKSRPVALQELAELKAFVLKEHKLEDLDAWDIGYYSEKLRVHKYDVSQETLRPYFPVNTTVKGMFEVVNRLYGIEIVQNDTVDTWHDDVIYYEIKKDQATVGSFYLDLYARANKRGGAWMDECKVRRSKEGDGIQLPVAYLVCNFTTPVGNNPALLTHDEVTTLFHEFGHGLHHMLTKINYSDVSGINGVAWDAVELPSQFMENWCWEEEALAFVSGHFETSKPLPKDLLEKMQAAKNFQSGMQMVRQLEFSLFDFQMHSQYNLDSPKPIQQVLDEVRDRVAVIKPPAFNRFQHGFSHIFAGGYAAGYYSYKWAEVLSADAFSLFEEQGIFNRETGQLFLESILEMGGSKEPMELFVNFRGRKPEIDALLRHTGINEAV